MKKTGLFKIILGLILLIAIASWFVKASVFDSTAGELLYLSDYAEMYGADIYRAVKIGFFDIFHLIFATVMYFSEPLIFILSVGAFYGVLSKTGKYRAWIDKIANTIKGNEKTFLIALACIIAIISSITGYGLLFLIFIPLLIGIIIAMGYDKTTAFITTFGAVIIGELGSLFNSNVTGQINRALGITAFKTGIIYRIFLLIIGLSFIVLYILKNKSNKSDYLKEQDLFVGEKNSNKYSVVPIIVLFSTLFVLLVLGCTNWKAFNINIFESFHAKLTSTEILSKLLGTYHGVMFNGSSEISIGALGTWSYVEMSIILLLSSLIIARFYKITHKEVFNNMIDGAKRMLSTSLLILLAYTILLSSQYYFPTIANAILNVTKGFNLIFSSITMALGTIVNVDIIYTSANTIPQIAAHGGNTKLLMVIAHGIYGFITLISPTSILLIAGLGYLELPYRVYIKNIWKLLLILLGAIFTVIIIANFEKYIVDAYNTVSKFIVNNWLYFVIGLVVIIGLVVFLIIKKRKK